MPLSCQNLRPEDRSAPRRRARGRRGHGRLRVLPAVAAPSRVDTARELGHRVRGRAQKVALSVDADNALLAAGRGAAAGYLAAARPGDARAQSSALKQRFGTAGDEGDRDRDAGRSRGRRDLRRGRRPAAVRRARAARGAAARAGSACPSTGAAQGIDPACRSCFPAGSTPTMSRRRCASRARPRRRCVLRRRARAGRQGCALRSAPSSRGARQAAARIAARAQPHDRAATQFLPHRPRRARHFGIFGGRFVAETLMPLILDLEKAYAEAKDDPAFKPRWTASRRITSAGQSPLYFAERLTAASRRRENLSQARGAQPHRRAQGQQRARPDPAGAAHGQDAHHRRDRRRHARRRDRHAVRALRAGLRRLHGRGRRRAAEAERVPHEDARRRGAAGRVRRRRRSRTR